MNIRKLVAYTQIVIIYMFGLSCSAIMLMSEYTDFNLLFFAMLPTTFVITSLSDIHTLVDRWRRK